MDEKKEEKSEVILYLNKGSTPSRAVWMTCEALGIQPQIVWIDLFKKEHMKPEFIKINPQHSVPTLADDGFYLWEERAIMTYLVDKYAKKDDLYPKDIKKRALVHRLLYFDMVPLYYSLSQWLYPQLFDGLPSNHYLESSVHTALQYLEGFLKAHPYATGDTLTIADIAILASVTFLEITGYDLSEKYPRTFQWVVKVKSELPFYEKCNQGLEEWKQLFKENTTHS